MLLRAANLRRKASFSTFAFLQGFRTTTTSTACVAFSPGCCRIGRRKVVQDAGVRLGVGLNDLKPPSSNLRWRRGAIPQPDCSDRARIACVTSEWTLHSQ
jgi:hypothetical protein